MKFTIKWLDEQLRSGSVVSLATELEVDIPDHAVRVGEALVFEAFDWSNHPACDKCQSGDPCTQIIGVYLAHRTARVQHEYDRSASSGPKPWPAASKAKS